MTTTTMNSFTRRLQLNARSAASCCVAGAIAVATAASAAADDWPQWHGPNLNNISSESGWAAAGRPESVWSKMVGLGYSNVVIRDGRLYTTGFNEDQEKDFVYCLEADTGKEVWSFSYPAKKWDKYHGGGTNATPSLGGDKLYHFNREGEFRCFNAATGEVVWEKKILEQYVAELPTWAFAASPLVLDDMVIINAGRTIAFDRDSGKELWHTADFGHAYATPTAFTRDGRDLLAVFSGNGLSVLDRTDGQIIDTFEWKTQYDVNAATPIVLDGERIFISSGYNHGCAMLTFDGSTLTPVWENKSMRNQMTGCVLIDGHLFGFDQSVLKCMDLDGKVVWEQRGLGQGALCGAGDKLIIASSKGELIVAKASPNGYEELSKADVVKAGGKTVCWTTPVLANGRIYIRSSAGELACRDHRESTAGR